MFTMAVDGKSIESIVVPMVVDGVDGKFIESIVVTTTVDGKFVVTTKVDRKLIKSIVVPTAVDGKLIESIVAVDDKLIEGDFRFPSVRRQHKFFCCSGLSHNWQQLKPFELFLSCNSENCCKASHYTNI